MGIKIKNLQTGEFEKFNIPALKGEKGEPGEIEPSEKVDYIGKQHSKLRDTMNANVDYIIKTAIGEFNYLDYEGQHITATNTIEGQCKSAILKGQTLVNIHNSTTFTMVAQNNNWFDNYVSAKNKVSFTITDTTFSGWRYINLGALNLTMLKPNTKYLVVFSEAKNITTVRFLNSNGSKQLSDAALVINGKAIVTTKSNMDLDMQILYIYFNMQLGEVAVKDAMIIEYVEGMENWDIPYFTGMASCKMPILSTVGKNLLPLGNSQDLSARGLIVTQKDGKLLINGVTTGTADYRVFNSNNNVEQMEKFNSLPMGTTITLSNNLGKENYFNVIRNGSSIYLKNTITIEDGDKGINAFIRFNTNETYDNTELYVQIEQGAVATSYEPYKSNILTVNEDIELRGIGDVQDTLDCLTGELNQRFAIFNDWDNADIIKINNYGLVSRYDLRINVKPRGKVKSNVFARGVVGTPNLECINVHSTHQAIQTQILTSKLSSDTIDGFKEWAKNNNYIIVYESAEKSIKTVDLSDNHVYSYKDVTHYDCSSAEGSLVPTLSVKVPTDTQLTIQEQKATTQTLLIKNMDLQQSIKEVQAMNLAFNTALYNSFNSIREEVEDIKKHVSTNENLEGSF